MFNAIKLSPTCGWTTYDHIRLEVVVNRNTYDMFRQQLVT
jgi:hypothetical protein